MSLHFSSYPFEIDSLPSSTSPSTRSRSHGRELDLVEDRMDVDQDVDEDQGAASDSSLSTSLPTSFFQSRMDSLRARRVSASTITTPLPNKNPLPLLEGSRDIPVATKRFFMMNSKEDGGDDDFDDEGALSTPTRPRGYHGRPPFSRSSSLLSRMHENGSLLGKHPQTPSPGEGPRSRSKGLKCLPVLGVDRIPRLPDFIRADSAELDISPTGFSPVRPINFGTPPGTPVKATPFNFFGSSRPGSASPAGSEDNPFSSSSRPKARFELDYLSESQWYSDYPHHLTEEYLEELFRLDKRVMFTQSKARSRIYPDYLKTNFYVNETVLGAGQFADVLKVQSKKSKEFYAVKRLLRTVQGAMERKHYLNEVRNMWRIEKNPHVVQLSEAWEQKGKIYMRLELCKLGNFKAALQAQKKYKGCDEKRVWRCLTDLASGLRAIHASNILHLDIKPENVFITATGSLKIGDFGHSVALPLEKGQDIPEGDKFYLPQELLNDKCGKYSDIFSLGMTVYEMITNRIGELPGEGEEWHRLRDGDFKIEDDMEVTPAVVMEPNSLNSGNDSNVGTPSGGSTPEGSRPSSAMSLSYPQTIVSEVMPASRGRQFSKEILVLTKSLMQPDFEQRPTAASIMNLPTIKAILTKRVEGARRGIRSEEAMAGLLLQSV
ncbi:hypothetical protein BGZ83_004518 [Gryganskiella cystojenkinii]|nr:hypothetical protein BGZ83_004518 [Gryganskiella cystojenkinii]